MNNVCSQTVISLEHGLRRYGFFERFLSQGICAGGGVALPDSREVGDVVREDEP